jgi:hypothetical protein
MKRKKNGEKDPLEGLEWASPTDKVYNIGLVVGSIPVSAVRPRKKSAGRKRKGHGPRRGKGSNGDATIQRGGTGLCSFLKE